MDRDERKPVLLQHPAGPPFVHAAGPGLEEANARTQPVGSGAFVGSGVFVGSGFLVGSGFSRTYNCPLPTFRLERERVDELDLRPFGQAVDRVLVSAAL